MEFGRKLLSKFGWEEGKGLGKLENGMVTPLKPKLKFDSTGIGFDYSKEYINDWWAQSYNEALKKVDVFKKKKKKRVEEDQSGVVNQKISKSFIKTETLLQDGSHIPEVNINLETNESTPLDFERLFELCGRRTAHKGARHGLGLSGKLARLEAQEKSLEVPFQQVLSFERNSSSPKSNMKYSSKNKRKSSKDCESRVVLEPNVSCAISGLNHLDNENEEVEEMQVSKKKKKKRKSLVDREVDYEAEDSSILSKDKKHKQRKLSEGEVSSDLENTCHLSKSKKGNLSKKENADVVKLDVEELDVPSKKLSSKNLEEISKDLKLKGKKSKNVDVLEKPNLNSDFYQHSKHEKRKKRLNKLNLN